MDTLLDHLTPEIGFWLTVATSVLVVCATVAVMTIIITAHLRKKWDATLKLEMVQRGLSAEDIERILHARTSAMGIQSSARRPSATQRFEQA